MGKGSNLYFQQQQARQMREMEKHLAAQSGQPLRRLTWTERNVLGLKEEPETHGRAFPRLTPPQPTPPQPSRRDPHPPADEVEVSGEPAGGTAPQAPPAVQPLEGSPGMGVRGHLIDVTWDGRHLTVSADNAAARIALRGPEHASGPLVLPAEQIASTELKPPGTLTNGHLTIRTTDGRSYLLHFRRKQSSAFARLYKSLPG
ncbi:hypothetical protein [Nocardioides sp.]|uniref:hypothetical protein n=1 Tax=Nocardioides sp. TaxID=35761 RepID=UPI0026328C91|nr:hypothetical protein [Nocardioides sp.]